MPCPSMTSGGKNQEAIGKQTSRLVDSYVILYLGASLVGRLLTLSTHGLTDRLPSRYPRRSLISGDSYIQRTWVVGCFLVEGILRSIH